MIIRDLPCTRIVTVDRVLGSDTVHACQMPSGCWRMLDRPARVIAVNPCFDSVNAAMAVAHEDDEIETIIVWQAAHVLIERK